MLLSVCIAMGFVAAQPLIVLDMEKCLAGMGGDTVLKYDALKFAGALQGLVNREEPRLLLRFLGGMGPNGPINVDDYWLSRMRESWLSDRPVERIETLDALFDRFPEASGGVVLWDQEVPATANVASTVCGVKGWLPVRADGELYKRLVDAGPKLPVKMSLVGLFDGSETGSKKCDAYRWAQREFLDKGLCNDALMAYYIDGYSQEPGKPGFHYPDLANAGLVNADYYIARRAFFFDLSPWDDEAPVDDPGQKPGTDCATLRGLLASLHRLNGGKKMATVGGFVPWNLKYTNFGPAGSQHEPVPAEWTYAAILSSYNAIMDADALGLVGMANASAYGHFPLKKRYKQNPRPAPQPLEPKTYVLVYMGDYDSAAWLSSSIPNVWDDPARGSMPIAWAFNPNLADRAPYVFDYVYRTKSPNDWFIAGDSGAGYLNPNLLAGDRLGSGLPDALELWTRHNKAYFKRFDYSITGFVINGFHGNMPLRIQEAYTRFSPDGVGMQLGFKKSVVGKTPFVRHVSDIYPDLNDLDKTAAQMAHFARSGKPQFLIYRMILQKPSTLAAVRDRLETKYPEHRWLFCDPYTFFDLYRRAIPSQK
ncbi:MAG TPA: GxGYxYP family putative glycoside hydrolase [Candidatus Hydrogenedentes bacterium]|nr:GxGYxYP family putative glycoside hydrolase [Candidatus Hydrogenedentota bacterium]HRT19689.1 GxGYxYP family putative glycoside hydrolase [Candidatus Hydrogenedentota bacterium]HRT64463.1 GxGYxYP family putative glycoside hydrolase [Candidatus Hydrogenedentota bacterium]